MCAAILVHNIVWVFYCQLTSLNFWAPKGVNSLGNKCPPFHHFKTLNYNNPRCVVIIVVATHHDDQGSAIFRQLLIAKFDLKNRYYTVIYSVRESIIWQLLESSRC